MVRVRMTISRKFFAVLAVLAPLVVAVALAGVAGLASTKSEFDQVFADDIHVSQISTTLGANLARADELALRLATATDPAERRSLNATLDQSVVPAVDAGLAELQAIGVADAAAKRAASERPPVARLARGWSQFVVLRDTGVLGAGSVAGGLGGSNRLIGQIAGIFDPLSAITRNQVNLEAVQAGQTHAQAVQTYDTSRLVIWAIAIGAFGLGIGSMLLSCQG